MSFLNPGIANSYYDGGSEIGFGNIVSLIGMLQQRGIARRNEEQTIYENLNNIDTKQFLGKAQDDIIEREKALREDIAMRRVYEYDYENGAFKEDDEGNYIKKRRGDIGQLNDDDMIYTSRAVSDLGELANRYTTNQKTFFEHLDQAQKSPDNYEMRYMMDAYNNLLESGEYDGMGLVPKRIHPEEYFASIVAQEQRPLIENVDGTNIISHRAPLDPETQKKMYLHDISINPSLEGGMVEWYFGHNTDELDPQTMEGLMETYRITPKDIEKYYSSGGKFYSPQMVEAAVDQGMAHGVPGLIGTMPVDESITHSQARENLMYRKQKDTAKKVDEKEDSLADKPGRKFSTKGFGSEDYVDFAPLSNVKKNLDNFSLPEGSELYGLEDQEIQRRDEKGELLYYDSKGKLTTKAKGNEPAYTGDTQKRAVYNRNYVSSNPKDYVILGWARDQDKVLIANKEKGSAEREVIAIPLDSIKDIMEVDTTPKEKANDKEDVPWAN